MFTLAQQVNPLLVCFVGGRSGTWQVDHLDTVARKPIPESSHLEVVEACTDVRRRRGGGARVLVEGDAELCRVAGFYQSIRGNVGPRRRFRDARR